MPANVQTDFRKIRPVQISNDDDEKPSKIKKGGKRNTVSYEMKTHCVDDAVVAEFLAEKRCRCSRGCIAKLAELGETGVELVMQLRRQRFAGESANA